MIEHRDLSRLAQELLPPRPVPWRKRVLWWLALRLIRVPPVRRALQRRYGESS
jgi:hypothetical protein